MFPLPKIKGQLAPSSTQQDDDSSSVDGISSESNQNLSGVAPLTRFPVMSDRKLKSSSRDEGRDGGSEDDELEDEELEQEEGDEGSEDEELEEGLDEELEQEGGDEGSEDEELEDEELDDEIEHEGGDDGFEDEELEDEQLEDEEVGDEELEDAEPLDDESEDVGGDADLKARGLQQIQRRGTSSTTANVMTSARILRPSTQQSTSLVSSDGVKVQNEGKNGRKKVSKRKEQDEEEEEEDENEEYGAYFYDSPGNPNIDDLYKRMGAMGPNLTDRVAKMAPELISTLWNTEGTNNGAEIEKTANHYTSEDLAELHKLNCSFSEPYQSERLNEFLVEWSQGSVALATMDEISAQLASLRGQTLKDFRMFCENSAARERALRAKAKSKPVRGQKKSARPNLANKRKRRAVPDSDDDSEDFEPHQKKSKRKVQPSRRGRQSETDGMLNKDHEDEESPELTYTDDENGVPVTSLNTGEEFADQCNIPWCTECRKGKKGGCSRRKFGQPCHQCVEKAQRTGKPINCVLEPLVGSAEYKMRGGTYGIQTRKMVPKSYYEPFWQPPSAPDSDPGSNDPDAGTNPAA